MWYWNQPTFHLHMEYLGWDLNYGEQKTSSCNIHSTKVLNQDKNSRAIIRISTWVPMSFNWANFQNSILVSWSHNFQLCTLSPTCKIPVPLLFPLAPKFRLKACTSWGSVQMVVWRSVLEREAMCASSHLFPPWCLEQGFDGCHRSSQFGPWGWGIHSKDGRVER